MGIETETELKTLVSLGVRFGQGYYLAKPSYPKSPEPISLSAEIAYLGSRTRDMKIAVPVKDLIKPAIRVSPETTVAKVKELLKDRSHLSCVVIVSEDKPKGLLMSYQMDRHLGTLYGVSLFYNRKVSLLMDHEPMIAEANQSVGEVAKAAMRRKDSKIYDDIIVTEHDEVIGTVPVQRMLENLAKIEIRARESAEAATKAKSSFLAAMSHDIRTPMNAILGMADLLWETPLSAEQKKYVSIFRSAGESLLSLINDILDLSKVEAGQIELEHIAFDLPELIESVREIMAAKAHQSNTDLSCHIDPDLPSRIKGDPVRLRQILMNLIGNAVKFTHNGEISVRAEKAEISEHDLLIRFSVKDTGIGIPKERHQDIFQSFTQADASVARKFGGTGLGLAICKYLSELMHGEIRVESELGIGSTFYFTARFSLCQDSAEDIQHAECTESEIGKDISPLRILLAEDNESNRLLFGFYLKDFSHHIDMAENGRICVDKYKSGHYDIVFMDIDMPIMDGYAATDAIRNWEKEQNLTHVPIIALTAHALKRKAAGKHGCGLYGLYDKTVQEA
ncbi:MAG: response regulator [Desulfobacteraceae bacterium]|nr:response regulator [Desulfobacteraceae bacterium]